MKITISPETEEEEKRFKEIVWENVYQYAITVSLMREKMFPTIHRGSQIDDPNQLIGNCEAVIEDIKDFKRKRNGITVL